MKPKLILSLMTVAYMASVPITSLFASPQTDDVTITAIVTEGDESKQSSDQANAKEDAQQASPQKRQSIRLRLNNGPVVLLRRAALDKDDAASGGAEQDRETRDAQDKDASPPKIWLGIGLKGIEGDLATYLGSSDGVFIESVMPDSPAAEAKLQEGDVVIAFEDQKISGPGALVDALRAVKAIEIDGKPEETTYPSITLKILRRGQEVKVELTPRQRPANLKIARTAEADDIDEVTNIFKFGQPGEATLNLAKPFAKTISNIVVVVKEDGKEYIVRVERNGDEPAKINVTEGNQQRQLSEDQLDQLPEKVRDAVKSALKSMHPPVPSKPDDSKDGENEKAKEQAFDEVREQLEKAMKQVGGGKIDIELKDLAESLKSAGQGRVIIIDPDKLQDVRKMAEDAKSMAEQWAESGVEQARGFAKLPEQIKDLKHQVDDLKKQVEELREELKASKK